MSLFQPIGVPTTNNFLVQILKAALVTHDARRINECLGMRAPADHDDRSGLAMASVSAGIGAEPVVPRTVETF
jgi:hypothetical protein